MELYIYLEGWVGFVELVNIYIIAKMYGKFFMYYKKMNDFFI